MEVEQVPEQLSHRTVRHRDEFGVEFSRIVAFSDGVFAIAITLLVLAIEIPPNVPDLGKALRNQEGDFLAYALSFAVIGKLWIAHHRFFTGVERFDNRLMGLNLFYLGWIALLPFTSEVLGDYGDQTDGVIVYAANLAAVGLIAAGMHLYCFRAGLVKEEVRPLQRAYTGPFYLVTPGVFLASIPIALFSPTLATLSWLLIFFISPQIRRL